MAYINPKTDYKDGDILYGSDLNASNEVTKKGVDDNYDRIKKLEVSSEQYDLDITDLKNGNMPIASKDNRGFVKIGANLNIDENGKLDAKDPYVLPIASSEIIGGVSLGDNIQRSENGKIRVNGVKGSKNIAVVEQDGDYYISYTGASFNKIIVDQLPEVGEEDAIYLVKKATDGASDIYDEYMWINGLWNPIGTSDTDLSNYYRKEEINELLSKKADDSDIVKEVAVSLTQPSDPNVTIWIDESDNGEVFDPQTVYKKTEINNLLSTLENNLTDYVDEELKNIDTEIPIASADVLGGIKIGENLEITEEGILNAIASSPYFEGTSSNPVYLNKLGYGTFVTKGHYSPREGTSTYSGSLNVWFLTPTNSMYLKLSNSDTIVVSGKNFNYSTAILGNQYSVLSPSQAASFYISKPIDNLTSTSTNQPLSANQGKALKALIDANKTYVDTAIAEAIGGVENGSY